MSRVVPLAATLLALATFLAGRTGRAWMETSVKSDNIELELARDGSAIVTHDLLVRIRGGPLKQWIVRDVDADATPLPDGTVVRARAGQAAGHPIPLTLSLVEGNLVARVEYKKGLRGGSYLFHFRYRTQLAERGVLRPAKGTLLLRWTGPSLDDGVDSMQLLLRVPKGASPPRLPTGDVRAENVSISEDFGGVFLSTLRRGAEVDELSIVRPHVAKLERVVWRAELDPGALDPALSPPKGVAVSPPDTTDAVTRGVSPLPSRWSAALALAIGLFFGVLVFAKSRAAFASCRARGGRPTFLVPLPKGGRPVVVAASLAGASWAGFTTSHPTLAGVLLLAGMACSVPLSPAIPTPLRGPGRWTEVNPKVLRAKVETLTSPARWLDAGTRCGFVLFSVLMMAVLGSAAWLFQRSPYHGVLVALLSSALLPVFCTGRQVEPSVVPAGSLSLLARALKKVARHRGVAVVPIARIAAATGSPDEYRLRVTVRRAVKGFHGLELGLDRPCGLRGGIAPFIVIRAEERSACQEALPKGLLWTRGRSDDERVAVLRPRVSTLSVWMQLTARLIRAVSAPPVGRGQSRTKAASSAGSAAVAVKPARPSSPAHAI